MKIYKTKQPTLNQLQNNKYVNAKKDKIYEGKRTHTLITQPKWGVLKLRISENSHISSVFSVHQERQMKAFNWNKAQHAFVILLPRLEEQSTQNNYQNQDLQLKFKIYFFLGQKLGDLQLRLPKHYKVSWTSV